MKTPCRLAFVSAVAVAVAEQSDGHLRTTRISPALDPARPHKFDKDYPDDGRPDIKMLKDKGFHDFKLPFPSVQGSDSFDRDYVKDENSDNGEWQAQADYDRLKGKLEKGQKALDAAKKREGIEKSKSDELAEKVKKLQDKQGEAKLNSEKKQKARAALEAEEKAAWDKFVKAREAAGNMTWSKVPTDPVDRAKWNLKKEEIEFEKCKKELEEARQHLIDVQKAYDAKVAAAKDGDAKAKAQLEAEADEEDKQAAALKGEEAKAKDDEDNANKDEASKKKAAAQAQKDADAEKAKMDQIQSAIALAKQRLEAAEAELQKAECALRHYRGEAPCSGNVEVPYVPGSTDLHAKKSSAFKTAGGSLLAALAVLTAGTA